MPFDFQRARPLLQTGNLTRLFVEELGWEPCRQKLTLRAGETDYALTAVAEKRGFTAWLCTRPEGRLPDHTTRLKLDRALTQTSFEHLIVFATQEGAQQSWMWVRREPGRPLSPRTHEFNRAQPGDSLLQKLQILYVSLEEEEKGELSTVTMAGRARAAFDIERVTKAFYRDFDTHRKAFLKFIEGIDEVADREWYASVMLNRLMFVYFIQRKGFLDADPDYLRNRLHRCRQENGKDDFYRFYRYFLLRLFHEGFGKRRQDRAPDLERLLGNIPYLNGGLFDIHELEKPERYGQAIRIPDQAFERVFDYFDQYEWHLDERPLRADNEINPDVLGYIFEKYINQKQMGAYYTKEDITEYISKSTIIPFLFDAARAKCRVAFDGGAGFQPAGPATTSPTAPAAKMPAPPPAKDACPTVWDLLREHPDRYIYPAVRHGVDRPLPPEIAAGLDTTKPDLIERRKAWNKPAPGDYALPTEIWREVVARRQRYWEVWSRLSGHPANPVWVANPPRAANFSPSPPSEGGEGRGEVGDSPLESVERSEIPTPRDTPPSAINEINDFITLNLDLRQFAQDVIQNCEGPDLLMAFWQAIATITVLDPTGGSGAFIFAALNILEPLYEACLDRMEAFLAEWGENGRKAHPNYHKKFTEVLSRVDNHPNRRYFVLKSIILNNLYAVDIMEEAVEICKLRLFLKLAAQVEPNSARDNLGIEPLPDIDFNIRAGNTLVGYATADEVRRCMKELGGGQMKLLDEEELGSFARFNTRCADVEQAFAKFRQLQIEGDGSVPAADKLELQKRLKALERELDRHLATEYGVKASDKAPYANWVKSHRPFHWFIQFYGTIARGGFDVIIGNPPYLEYSKVNEYKVRNYRTKECANLYVFTVERSYALISPHGRAGMIIPISIACSGALAPLREEVAQATRSVWLSHFSNRPGQLFTGAQNRLTIIVTTGRRTPPQQFSTHYHRWDAKSGERENLFPLLRYEELAKGVSIFHGLLPKMGCREAANALEKIRSSKTLQFFKSRTGRHKVYWARVPGYFCQFFLDPPMARPQGGGAARVRGEVNDIGFDEKSTRHVVHAVLNSSTYYQFFCTYTDTRHINPSDVSEFPLDLTSLTNDTKDRLAELSARLSKAFAAHTTQWRKSGLLIDSTDSKPCKPLLDEIDIALAEHYGFTAEELDFILNYDIKYRLGRDTEGQAE